MDKVERSPYQQSFLQQMLKDLHEANGTIWEVASVGKKQEDQKW